MSVTPPARATQPAKSAQTATANQIEAMQPKLVAILGDEQYQVGRYQDFMGSFDHTYGAFKFLQRPSPGNHEFYTSHGETGDDGYGATGNADPRHGIREFIVGTGGEGLDTLTAGTPNLQAGSTDAAAHRPHAGGGVGLPLPPRTASVDGQPSASIASASPSARGRGRGIVAPRRLRGRRIGSQAIRPPRPGTQMEIAW